MDPSYSRRLRQITRSECERARGRSCLNTPGDSVYKRPWHLERMCIILHTGLKWETVDENDSRIFGIFDWTAVGVVEDDIISNRQRGHCGSSKKGCSARQEFLSMKPIWGSVRPLHAQQQLTWWKVLVEIVIDYWHWSFLILICHGLCNHSLVSFWPKKMWNVEHGFEKKDAESVF